MYTILLGLLMAPGMSAEEVKKPATPRPASVPREAEDVQTGVWKHKEGGGETWLYRRTPFGVAKYKEEAAVDADDSGVEGVRAFEEGDSVRFERKTPFGVSQWTRKKTDLKGVEPAAWKQALAEATESTKSKPAASRPAEGKKE